MTPQQLKYMNIQKLISWVYWKMNIVSSEIKRVKLLTKFVGQKKKVIDHLNFQNSLQNGLVILNQ